MHCANAERLESKNIIIECAFYIYINPKTTKTYLTKVSSIYSFNDFKFNIFVLL